MISSTIKSLSFFAIFAICACSATTTTIYTQPAGAKLILDHKKSLGNSPVAIRESVWSWTKRDVTASHPGFQSRTIKLENTGFNAGGVVACICTAGILFPMFFRSSYLPQYLIELAPAAPEKTAINFETPISFKE